MYIPADKTTNYYRLNTDSYNQLINTAITKSYKKAPSSAPNQIISEERKIATGLNLQNRMDALSSKNAFITLKDHKPNFQNKPTCRLINPTKLEIGIVSKETPANKRQDGSSYQLQPMEKHRRGLNMV